MDNKLNELVTNHGMNFKSLSKKINIPYTTLIDIANKDINKWHPTWTTSVAKALNLDPEKFYKIMNSSIISPFIKWVGGKRQLLPILNKYVPKNFNTYYEPFIGGGALLLKIAPNKAVINDLNKELVNTWKVLSNPNNTKNLVQILKKHQNNDSKEYYLNIRKADRDGRIVKMTPAEKAARFIYLNKAGYNGLWRVNLKGQNNVPYGSHKHLNLLPKVLMNDALYLQNNDIKITSEDYKESIKNAKKNDLVYFDPPYIPVNETSSFTSYTSRGFGLIQQKQLRNTALELSKHGVKIMLSNSDVPLTNELYKNKVFHIHHVQAKRFINSNAKKRGNVGEVIITNY